jgi:hypothetical protein
MDPLRRVPTAAKLAAARQLGRTATPAERHAWTLLRNRRLPRLEVPPPARAPWICPRTGWPDPDRSPPSPERERGTGGEARGGRSPGVEPAADRPARSAPWLGQSAGRTLGGPIGIPIPIPLTNTRQVPRHGPTMPACRSLWIRTRVGRTPLGYDPSRYWYGGTPETVRLTVFQSQGPILIKGNRHAGQDR